MEVAFFDTKEYDKQFFNEHNKNYNLSIHYYKDKLSAETVHMTQGYEMVCVFVNDDIGKEVVEKLYENGVKLVAFRSAGYNNIDIEACRERVQIVRVPDYSPYAVAEHVVALIMTLNRNTHKAYYRTKERNFEIKGLMGFDMNEKTVGVIGTGKIGKILIKILKGFGMHVLAYDKYKDEAAASQLGFSYVEFDEILKNADILSLHCPLTEETQHMINRESIGKMKDGVMLINTSRGQLIHTEDLIEGLKIGKIGSAGLDVYEEEKNYFFEDYSNRIIQDEVLSHLLMFPNVLITSHQAFFTREAMHNIAEITLKNMKQFIDGEELLNEVHA